MTYFIKNAKFVCSKQRQINSFHMQLKSSSNQTLTAKLNQLGKHVIHLKSNSLQKSKKKIKI